MPSGFNITYVRSITEKFKQERKRPCRLGATNRPGMFAKYRAQLDSRADYKLILCSFTLQKKKITLLKKKPRTSKFASFV